jgi:hypothetical protein
LPEKDEGAASRLENESLLAELKRLILAEADMKQTEAGARYIEASTMNEDAHRALQTGVMVCYARPFTRRQGIGPLDRKEWAPGDVEEQALHRSILVLRDKVFAHTDDTDMREIVDAYALLGIGAGSTSSSGDR